MKDRTQPKLSLGVLASLFAASVIGAARVFAEGPCPATQIDPSLLPLKPGMLVATCFPGYNTPFIPSSGLKDSYAVAIVDTRTPFTPNSGGPVGLGLNWCAPKYHNDNAASSDQWRAGNIGQVFGITLDTQNPPNIYVAAATVYAPPNVYGGTAIDPLVFPGGAAAGGQIYRLDGSTGAVSKFARLPNSAEGLGNICYDAAHRQFFVTNFDDGLIYRLPTATQPANGLGWTGTTWDHGLNRPNATNTPALNLSAIPDTPSTDFTPLGRRVWAVQVSGNRLFYSTWGQDSTRPNPGTLNEVWSVPLNATTGDFATGAQPTREFVVPGVNCVLNSASQCPSPVSSIAFSPSGTMFVAQRTRRADTGLGNNPTPEAHDAEVLEYTVSGNVWSPSPRMFYVGDSNSHHNSAGGVDVESSGDVWITGDSLVFLHTGAGTNYPPQLLPQNDPASYIYGLQKSPAAGNSNDDVNFPPTYVGLNSVYVDLDGDTNSINKAVIGALVVYRNVGEPPSCLNCCGEKPRYDDDTYSTTFTGQVAVGTGYARNLTGNDSIVLRIFDLKNQASAPLSTNYQPPVFSGPTVPPRPWNKEYLGNIFGLTLDDLGNIYVSATSCYNTDYFPSGADGGEIYKIGAASGLKIAGTGPNNAWVHLPSPVGPLGSPALGNINFDCEHDNFYASDMFNGYIYRIDRNGSVLTHWDHGANLSPPIIDPQPHEAGFTRLGRRIWGLQAHCGRLYYAVWWEDSGRPDANHDNEIWSVALDATGDFIAGSQQLEVTMPPVTGPQPLPTAPYSNPVSDISFGPTGVMLLTERAMQNDTTTVADGSSRAVECYLAAGSWSCNSTKYKVGLSAPPGLPGTSAGGGDYDFGGGGRTWVTGDDLHVNFNPFPPFVYIDGLQGLPSSGGNVGSSILIDENNVTSVSNATEIGDVEIPCPSCEVNGTVVTPTTAGGAYTYQFTITNHSNQAASNIVIQPVSGTTSISPQTFHFSPPLGPNATSQSLTLTLNGAQPGTQVCFNIALLASDGTSCCSLQVCVPIPSCFEVISQTVDCSLGSNMVRVTVTFKNLESYTIYHAAIIPSTPGMTATPSFVNVGPVAQFGTGTVSTVFFPVTPGQTVFYTLTIHAADLAICCSRDLSFTANCPDRPAPAFVSAVSRMPHGDAGDFDIPLPASSTPGVENRRSSMGGALHLIFSFDQDVANPNVSITGGSGAVQGTPTTSGNQLDVHLTNVADAQTLSLHLDVTDNSGQQHTATDYSIGVLAGDVNGDGVVNAADATIVRNHSGQTADATNFRADVNCDGNVNAADATVVRAHSGRSLNGAKAAGSARVTKSR